MVARYMAACIKRQLTVEQQREAEEFLPLLLDTGDCGAVGTFLADLLGPKQAPL